MAQHTSVGARNFSSALVLQAKTTPVRGMVDIETNEFGLMQAQLLFALTNDQWPAKQPTRGTPCSSFVGDTLTMGFLNGISFMGAQSSRFTPNGKCPGIGILNVMCQGAKFSSGYEAGAVTPYFLQTTTTLTDLNFSSFSVPAPAPAPGGLQLNARVGTTSDLGAFVNGTSSLKALQPGALVIDGVALSNGNVVLVKNQGSLNQNGLYIVTYAGLDGTGPFNLNAQPWTMARSSLMNQSSQFVNTTKVFVSDGTANHGTLWDCQPDPSFIINVSNVTFALSGTQPASTALAPQYNVHILYHAIDVHFQYMAATRQQKLRYVQDTYALNADNTITIVPGINHQLSVEKAEAQTSTSTTPGAWASIADSEWRPHVFLPGTSAQLQQVPAGQFFSVLETATIKIQNLAPDVSSIAP